MSSTESMGLSNFKLELLKGTNWFAWKRRILAILRELDLVKFVEINASGTAPKHPKPVKPTKIVVTSKGADGEDTISRRD